MSAQPTTTLGTKIVKETYTDLAGSPTVKRSVGNAQLNPEARIDRYLERLQRVLNREAKRSDSLAPHERLAERLIRNSCLDLSNSELVDKIARGIYDSERRAAYQQGHGANLEQLPYDQVKEDYIPLVREKHSAQRDTLSRWTDYLRKNDGHYPAWFRYLAVRGVLKMGEYNRDTPSFHKRTDTTIAPFPDLNSEALGLVFKILSEPEKLGEVLASFDLTNIEPLRAALATKRFANLYAVALRECNKSIDRSRLEGEWRKYDQGPITHY